MKVDGTTSSGLRVAIYTRVSTDHQAEEGFSMEVQHEKLMEYINRNKLMLFKFYSDPGVSAKNLNRPGIKELLRDFDDDLFDIILVHKLDRLTRNIGDLHNLVEMINDRKKKLISYTEDIDTSTPAGRMFVYFLGVIAQMYRENLGEEVTKGMRKRVEKGMHNISVDLYGYTRDTNGDLMIKEEEAQWVRWAFEHYVSGMGSTEISIQLNNMGIIRNRGGRWEQSNVIKMLENMHYIGKVHCKFKRDDDTTISEGKHEPIITDDLFEKAQRVLQRRRDGMISNNSYEYVFGGIVKCGVCGATYTGRYSINRSPSRKVNRHYVCSNNVKHKTCHQAGISEIKLAKLLFDSIQLIGKNYTRKDMPKKERSEYDEIQKAIKASEDRRERWQLAYGDGNMPYEDFSKRMRAEMERIQELEKKLSTIPQQVVSYLTPESAATQINDLKYNWNYLDQNTKKEIMQSLFQQIVILKTGDSWEISKLTLA
ncbi:hypothetical protein AMQ84_26975 [Paenibacillus riograndensis]|uniref:Resolvase n=1 Tax=Paenibacillus riograndensis TaxID=483937 RepID=A0A132TJQ7_9BACL|nr:recombinase family protein [Paenibacillus riograndensis]KWX71575.1 hypothetical protein AMQ84_26975 [Paenibacillus riograndensis]